MSVFEIGKGRTPQAGPDKSSGPGRAITAPMSGSSNPSTSDPKRVRAQGSGGVTITAPRDARIVELFRSRLDGSSAKLPEQRADLAGVFKPLEDALDARRPHQKVKIKHGGDLIVLDVRATPEGVRILIPQAFSEKNDGLMTRMVDGLSHALEKHVSKTGVVTRVELIAQNVTNSKLTQILDKFGFEKRPDIGWTTGQKVLGAAAGVMLTAALYFQTELLWEIAVPMGLVFVLRQGESRGVTFSMTPKPKRDNSS